MTACNCNYSFIWESIDIYLFFRQKLESIAETVIGAIIENRKNASNPKIMRRIKEEYVIFFKKHDHRDDTHNHSINSSSVVDRQYKNADEDQCHLLSLHMSTLEMRHEFRARSKKGCVTTFSAPVGSLVVAIGRRLEVRTLINFMSACIYVYTD